MYTTHTERREYHHTVYSCSLSSLCVYTMMISHNNTTSTYRTILKIVLVPYSAARAQYADDEF